MSGAAMASEHVPYLVLSERRRASIALSLRQILGDVIGRDMPVTVSLVSESKQQTADNAKGKVWALHSADGAAVCHCFVGDGFLHAILASNARGGRMSVEPGSVAALVKEAVHEAMGVRLASAWKLSLARDSNAVSFRDVSQPQMHRWIACAFGDAPAAVLLVHPSIIERCVPADVRQSPSNERIVKRAQAIRHNEVHIEVVLGEAEVTCADLAKLAVGDVLVVDRELSAPVDVVTADGRVVGGARLGREGARLAAHLV
jgi:flagellar motor switch/type III secretory pathway protein FliN